MRHLGLPAISNRLLTLFMANAQQRQGFNMLEEIGHLTKCIWSTSIKANSNARHFFFRTSTAKSRRSSIY
jgi:hypothetical protein